MNDLLPFGTPRPMGGALRERAGREHETFGSWVTELDTPAGQVHVLNELLNLVDEREFVEGHPACVTREAKLARPTGLAAALPDVLADLKNADLLTSHRATEVFDDGRSGMVLRVRRPGVVLTVEAAGLLWVKDSWLRNRKGGLS